jgi:L-amino acid N-acyltransferase YncA
MNNQFEIRLVEDTDFAGMLAVYAPSVINTAITFEYDVPSLDEYSERIKKIASHYPCLVCELNGEIAGYAYGSIHRVKTAYQWSVESTIYVGDRFHGKGVARVLYHALLSVLELQGFVNVYAGVTTPNPQSERFHLAMGFAEIAVFEKIGYKLGKWHDLKFFEMYLAEHSAQPVPPISIGEVCETEIFKEILDKANEVLNE